MLLTWLCLVLVCSVLDMVNQRQAAKALEAALGLFDKTIQPITGDSSPAVPRCLQPLCATVVRQWVPTAVTRLLYPQL